MIVNVNLREGWFAALVTVWDMFTVGTSPGPRLWGVKVDTAVTRLHSTLGWGDNQTLLLLIFTTYSLQDFRFQECFGFLRQYM